MTEQKPIKTLDEWVDYFNKVEVKDLFPTAQAMGQAFRDAIKTGIFKEEDLSIEPLLAPLREYYKRIGQKPDSDLTMVRDYLRYVI